MDNSYPMFNRSNLLGIIISVVASTVLSAFCILLLEDDHVYISIYATLIMMVIGIFGLFDPCTIRWNAFLIASGTDRTDFIKSRFIKLMILDTVVAALFSCLDIIMYGLNYRTVILMISNISMVLITVSLTFCVFARLGARFRSDAQTSIVIILLPVIAVVINAIFSSIAKSCGSPIVSIPVLAVALIVTVVCYRHSVRTIRKVDF